MTALATIQQAGFTVKLKPSGNLGIAPADKLTGEHRAYLKSHKPEIIAELQAKAANNEIKPTVELEGQIKSVVELSSDQTEVITDWIESLGCSPETIAEELADCLEHCRRDPEALEYFIKCGSDESTIPSKPPHPNNTRRFCRKYQHSNHVYGWDDQVIRCAVQNQVNDDNLPRHCSDFATNGLPIPTVGVRWQPESIPPQCTAIPKVEYPRFVECFTPEGISIQIMSNSAEHKAFLLKMNPKNIGENQ